MTDQEQKSIMSLVLMAVFADGKNDAAERAEVTRIAVSGQRHQCSSRVPGRAAEARLAGWGGGGADIPLQMKMVYRIGKSYGFDLDRGHIKDFLATAGVGMASQYV